MRQGTYQFRDSRSESKMAAEGFTGNEPRVSSDVTLCRMVWERVSGTDKAAVYCNRHYKALSGEVVEV